MNQTSKNFTTTLPTFMLRELDHAAKDLHVGKNDILTEAFLKWNRIRKQKMVAESYAKANMDPEWRGLAEMGMEDWNENIQAWEK